MTRTTEEVAQMIGILMVGSGYEKLLLELALVDEKDFDDVGEGVKKTDTVIGTLSRFERAARTLATRIEKELEPKIKELGENVCHSCPACGDSNSENAPCRDLKVRALLPDELRNAVWDSIRKRLPCSSSIGIRSGFTVVNCLGRPRGVEVIIGAILGNVRRDTP